MEKNQKAIENGVMTSNLEDIIALGKQMDRLRDGQELKEDERIADPIQFEETEQH